MIDILPNVVSSIAFIILIIGRLQVKKNLKLHIQLVSLAMIIDLLLVIALVIFRNALGKVAQGALSPMLAIHISFAISTLVLYGFATFYGVKVKKGERKFLPKLKKIDPFLFIVRFFNSFTSWILYFI